MARVLEAPKGIKPLSQVPETCILFVELRSRNIIQLLNRSPKIAAFESQVIFSNLKKPGLNHDLNKCLIS